MLIPYLLKKLKSCCVYLVTMLLEGGNCIFHFFFFFFGFLGPHSQHMEVPRRGVESELQLLALITATAMPDPSHACDLHHNSWQRRTLNSVIKPRDRTHILMDTSWIHFSAVPQRELSVYSSLITYSASTVT